MIEFNVQVLSALLTEMDGMGGKEQDGLGSGKFCQPQLTLKKKRLLLA